MILEKQRFDLPPCFGRPFEFNHRFAFAGLLVLLLCIYANSFEAGWHYDDDFNIVQNSHIRMETFSWEAIIESVKDSDHHMVSRPLAYLSFALNYFFNGYNLFGYHMVNFLIHCCASIFLYLFIRAALRLPACMGRFDRSADAVALLSLFFWAPHPIHVTAVTYIVQRMAAMAGMFYIMGLYFFLKARTCAPGSQRVFFFALCLLCAIFAFGSKENAIMLPPALFLFEILILQSSSALNSKRNWVMAGAIIMLTLFVSSYYLDLSQIGKGFETRPFTLLERLLTEPRVIVFYLSLLFYPTTSRLTLLHDVPVSTGFFSPITTLPAILFLAALIAAALAWRRRQPFFTYCILFFFLNHIVEGSFIALELVYEHRNYIPSMLLFVPVSAAVIQVLTYFEYNRKLQVATVFCAIFVLVAQAHTTHCYNAIFKDRLTLWKDNIQKSPNLSISYNNFGQALWAAGFKEPALKAYETALRLDRYNNHWQKGLAYYNIGLHTAYEDKHYSTALEQLIQARSYLPGYPEVVQHIALVALLLDKAAYAAPLISEGLRLWPGHQGLIMAQAILLLIQREPADAFYFAGLAYRQEPRPLTALFVMAEACRRKKDLDLSLSYWKKVMAVDPTSALGAFALTALYGEMKNDAQKERYIGLLRYLNGEKNMRRYWESVRQEEINRFFIPSWQSVETALSGG